MQYRIERATLGKYRLKLINIGERKRSAAKKIFKLGLKKCHWIHPNDDVKGINTDPSFDPKVTEQIKKQTDSWVNPIEMVHLKK